MYLSWVANPEGSEFYLDLEGASGKILQFKRYYLPMYIICAFLIFFQNYLG